MVVRSDIQQQAGETARAKASAKECLIAADKFLKDRQFDKARQQVDKAREIDPANPYISAFEERIKIFEEQLKSQAMAPPKPPPAPEPEVPPVAAPPAASIPKQAPHAPPKPAPSPVVPAPKPVEVPKATPPPKPPIAEPAPVPPPKAPIADPTPVKTAAAAVMEEKIKLAVSAAMPVAEETKPAPKRYVVPEPPPVKRAVPPSGAVEQPKPSSSSTPTGDELRYKMDEMSRQISELSQALVAERHTRGEILKKQLENTVAQFREALRKAWSLGAPKEAAQDEFHQLARSLNLDDDVITSVTREVKLEMYGKAVKEMLAKRKLIRSSSSTMEWLRKVYQVSMAEYLEYESRFLLDLVTDQFRGTLLLVASSDPVRRDMAARLKSSGFAVVSAATTEEALEKIERVSPTIIVTETQFPGRSVSGVMFLQLLRANPKYAFVPVLLVCDAQEAVTLMSSELREIEGVVKTPVDYDELNAIINEKLTKLRNYISNM